MSISVRTIPAFGRFKKIVLNGHDRADTYK
jgi:hypothetical protein